MEYKMKFKRLEEGNDPEKNYVSIGNGLQYQEIEGAPSDVILSTGVLLGKLLSISLKFKDNFPISSKHNLTISSIIVFCEFMKETISFGIDTA